MKIRLSPVFKKSDPLIAEVIGDIIIVNGVTYDFTPLCEGSILPNSATPDCFFGDVTRIDGVINLTLVLPHSSDAPYETRFPSSFHEAMNIDSGKVKVPAYGEDIVDSKLNMRQKNGI